MTKVIFKVFALAFSIRPTPDRLRCISCCRDVEFPSTNKRETDALASPLLRTPSALTTDATLLALQMCGDMSKQNEI